jgi:hypothetical protein
MKTKKTARRAGLTSDGLVVGMAGAASLVLLVDSMCPEEAQVDDGKAREHAKQLAAVTELAVAAGRTDLAAARDVRELVAMVSAGITVPNPKAFGIEMVSAPTLTVAERAEASKFLRFGEDGTLVYSED